MDIFDQRKERELQRLRQAQASNRIVIDPNLRGFTQRFNPDVSRETLLRLQRSKVPTKEELEKDIGVQTAKKLKKRRGKNLRGEVARSIREQKRFEVGERRYKDSEEPRIFGEAAPVQGGGGGVAYDPEVERERIRVQALGQLQTARLSNRRLDIEARQLDINRQLADRDRGEIQRQFNIQTIEDRDRLDEDTRQRERDRKLQRTQQRQALDSEEYREQLKDYRVKKISKADIRLREKEIDILEQREARKTAEEQRKHLQALGESQERLRPLRQPDLAEPVPEGLSQADREFLQRGFTTTAGVVDRRIGESEARIQEQIRVHAGRVHQQQPVDIRIINPEPRELPQPAGPTAEQIASRVREGLEQFLSPQGQGETGRSRASKSPRRRIEVREASSDSSEEDYSPRRAQSPVSEVEEDPVFSPAQSPRRVTPERGQGETGEEISLEESFIDVDVDSDTAPLPEPELQEDLFSSQQVAGDLASAAQNAIGFVGDVAGRAASGIVGLFEPNIGEQTGGALVTQTGEPIFGLGQEIEEVDLFEDPQRPTLRPLQSEAPERRPLQKAIGGGGAFSAPVQRLAADEIRLTEETAKLNKLKRSMRSKSKSRVSPQQLRSQEKIVSELEIKVGNKEEVARQRIENIELKEDIQRQAQEQGQELSPLLEETGEGVDAVDPPSVSNQNYRLYESILPELGGYYVRGRPQGGARGALPYNIINTSNRDFKGLKQGQSVSIERVEKDGKLGYYGDSGVITRISESELRKQVKAGKLKLDNAR
tara:strand:- start:2335 stop:4644 length:2310 start_codon:yes stop_codon:yes gene_type:complete